MRIDSWEEVINNPNKNQDLVLTIGVFDGIHLGHQELIKRVISNENLGVSSLITFKQNPETLLNSKKFKGNILSLDQKLEKIQNLGIQYVILIDFSEDFSKIAGREFIKLLLNSISLRKMIIGYNFRFGYQRTIGRENLESLIIPAQLEIVNPVDYNNFKISSTRIRDMIYNGNLDKASVLLGTPYCVDLRQLSLSDSHSRLIIKKSELNQLLPESGKYLVQLKNTKVSLPGEINIDHESMEIRAVSDIACKEIDYIRF